MTLPLLLESNFAMLAEDDEQLYRLGVLAERDLSNDPAASQRKLRHFTDLLLLSVALRTGHHVSAGEPQNRLIRRLQDVGLFPREVAQLFNEVQQTGSASGLATNSDHRTALATLKLAWQL